MATHWTEFELREDELMSLLERVIDTHIDSLPYPNERKYWSRYVTDSVGSIYRYTPYAEFMRVGYRSDVYGGMGATDKVEFCVAEHRIYIHQTSGAKIGIAQIWEPFESDIFYKELHEATKGFDEYYVTSYALWLKDNFRRLPILFFYMVDEYEGPRYMNSAVDHGCHFDAEPWRIALSVERFPDDPRHEGSFSFTNYPQVYQSPITPVLLRNQNYHKAYTDIGEVIKAFKIADTYYEALPDGMTDYGIPNLDVKTNWWDDSTVRVKATISDKHFFIILQADNAPHWMGNVIPSIPIYFGNIEGPGTDETKAVALFAGTAVPEPYKEMGEGPPDPKPPVDGVEVVVCPGEIIEVGYIDIPAGNTKPLTVTMKFETISGASFPDINMVSPNGEKFGYGWTYLPGGGYQENTTNTSSSKGVYTGWQGDDKGNENMTFYEPIEGRWIVYAQNWGGNQKSKVLFDSNFPLHVTYTGPNC